MNVDGIIGLRLEDARPILDKLGLNFDIIQVFDPKVNKIGDEERIINIRENGKIIIYTAFF